MLRAPEGGTGRLSRFRGDRGAGATEAQPRTRGGWTMGAMAQASERLKSVGWSRLGSIELVGGGLPTSQHGAAATSRRNSAVIDSDVGHETGLQLMVKARNQGFICSVHIYSPGRNYLLKLTNHHISVLLGSTVFVSHLRIQQLDDRSEAQEQVSACGIAGYGKCNF